MSRCVYEGGIINVCGYVCAFETYIGTNRIKPLLFVCSFRNQDAEFPDA